MGIIYWTNKKTGITYAYENTAYWDKEKKQMRNKQRCIGKLDPETGEFIPSKRLGPHAGPALDPAITATTTITGPRLILQQIDQDLAGMLAHRGGGLAGQFILRRDAAVFDGVAGHGHLANAGLVHLNQHMAGS